MGRRRRVYLAVVFVAGLPAGGMVTGCLFVTSYESWVMLPVNRYLSSFILYVLLIFPYVAPTFVYVAQEMGYVAQEMGYVAQETGFA